MTARSSRIASPGNEFSVYLTPKFSCKHSITIAAKPHPKSACLLQRSLDRGLAVRTAQTNAECQLADVPELSAALMRLGEADQREVVPSSAALRRTACSIFASRCSSRYCWSWLAIRGSCWGRTNQRVHAKATAQMIEAAEAKNATAIGASEFSAISPPSNEYFHTRTPRIEIRSLGAAV